MALSTLLDANVVLYALRGQLDEVLPATDLRISVITEIELLGYPDLSPAEEAAVRSLIAALKVVPLGTAVKEETIRLKRTLRLRLPDAVILATASVTGSELLTNDRELAARATVPCRSLRLRPTA